MLEVRSQSSATGLQSRGTKKLTYTREGQQKIKIDYQIGDEDEILGRQVEIECWGAELAKHIEKLSETDGRDG